MLLLALALRESPATTARHGAWWQVVATGAVLTMLLPPVVYGGGAVGLALPAVAVAIATLVAAVVLCFAHSARPWAYDVVAADPAPSGG